MKLLNEKEIEEAAKVADEQFGLTVDSDELSQSYNYIAGFNAGVLFTEQKLLQLICEFGRFVSNDIVSSRIKREYKRFYVPNESMTMDKIFELFIKERYENDK